MVRASSCRALVAGKEIPQRRPNLHLRHTFAWTASTASLTTKMDILRISQRPVERAMQVQVARWGNSLGLRIPKDIALRAGLREGARVELEAEGDRIIISPARPRDVLADLLKGMTRQAMREAFDWGPDKGREIVE